MVIVPILFGIGILGIVMILVLAEKDFNEPESEQQVKEGKANEDNWKLYPHKP